MAPPHPLEPVIALLRERQAACGTTRVVAIDGPSGSGKSRLADRLVAATGAALLRLEDIYPGWHGLDAIPPLVASMLADVAADRIGRARRWDWVADEPGEVLQVRPAPLLVLDGVGSGAAVVRPYVSVLVWVEAPVAVRKRRALARDGQTYAPFWDVWAAQERTHFAAEGTRRHADVIVRTDAGSA